jgi:zinc protease
VKAFVARAYTRAALTVGISGDAPEDLEARSHASSRSCRRGRRSPRRRASRPVPAGSRSTIVEKETRATAISLGHPIAVTRSHPDFAALYLARTWLGEHRSSMSHLYQRIRELRGMNYGDYAYIEAFPRGMFQFFPEPEHRAPRPALRDLDPPGDPGERAHGAAHRAARAATG